MRTLLKCIVGSQAHGLAGPDSDFDYRGVFVLPTEEILKLGGKTDQTSWIEGKEDDTAWEVSKFLSMATKSNPTVLETFLAPVGEGSEWSDEIRALFPHVWNSADVKNAFIGYAINQRKKFFENQGKRAPKFACANLRVLYSGWEILSTGTFSINLEGTPVFEQCRRFKAGDYQVGEVVQACYYWEEKVRQAYAKNPDKKTNMEPVNELLLRIRKAYWSA